MAEVCGIITFYSSQHAVQAEQVLKAAGFSVELVPGPKDISANCGVAIKYDYQETELIRVKLTEATVKFEAFHHYTFGPGNKSLLDRLMGR